MSYLAFQADGTEACKAGAGLAVYLDLTICTEFNKEDLDFHSSVLPCMSNIRDLIFPVVRGFFLIPVCACNQGTGNVGDPHNYNPHLLLYHGNKGAN